MAEWGGWDLLVGGDESPFSALISSVGGMRERHLDLAGQGGSLGDPLVLCE